MIYKKLTKEEVTELIQESINCQNKDAFELFLPQFLSYYGDKSRTEKIIRATYLNGGKIENNI